MGISQLLPLLEKSTRSCHISEFRGQTVAIDSYCWLHKGARSCALQLAVGESTDQYVVYCMKYVKMLLSYDIKPIMVFDGRPLPAKLGTEDKRKELKKHAKKQAMEFLKLGQRDEAYKYFCQCIEVSPQMALALIKECRKINVDCIVAPYEADAQLAFFFESGVIKCAISEDSDLLLFGCKKVLYKMDSNGCGQLVEADKLYQSMKIREEQFSFDKFRHMCILAGCDYLDSLPGIGIKKSLKFITMTAELDPKIFLGRLPRYLNMKNLQIPEDYAHKFLIADATFKYQIVFNPFIMGLTPLNEIENGKECYCINAGVIFDREEAIQLALGNLNPLTMEKIDNWDPKKCILNSHSIWSSSYIPYNKPKTERKVVSEKKSCIIIDQNQENKETKSENVLELYKSPVSEEKTIVESKEKSPLEESQTSPVLSGNPFIRKKISKFQLTNPQISGQKVLSRFFSNSTEENKAENESQIEKTQQSDNSDELNNVPQIECECVLEIEDRVITVLEDTTLLTSVENLSNDAVKKRKLMSDPNPKKKIKRQLTIQDMFKKN